MADMPAPPHCSGNWMPIRPSSASFGMSALGNCCASSHSRTNGRISPSANSRTVCRSNCCSSVSWKCTVAQYETTTRNVPELSCR